MTVLGIILIVVALILGLGIGAIIGNAYRKKVAEAEIGSAEQEAKRIVTDAMKTAEAKKKEAILEGKDEVHRLRNESEKEIADRRKEVQRQERRIQQKEETLDRKIDNVEKKEERVNKKIKEAEGRLAEAETIKKSQFEMLERISGYTVDQASWAERNRSRSWSMSSSSRMNPTSVPATSSPLRSSVALPIRSRRRPYRLSHCRMTR